MILYLDTSALVKMYVAEEGSAEVKKRVRQADTVSTSRVAYPEARSALARRHREGSISSSGLRKAVSDIDKEMGSFVIVELNESIARLAGEMAERHALRGFDAIHLASAIELGRMVGEAPDFITYDDNQALAAEEEGLIL